MFCLNGRGKIFPIFSHLQNLLIQGILNPSQSSVSVFQTWWLLCWWPWIFCSGHFALSHLSVSSLVAPSAVFSNDSSSTLWYDSELIIIWVENALSLCAGPHFSCLPILIHSANPPLAFSVRSCHLEQLNCILYLVNFPPLSKSHLQPCPFCFASTPSFHTIKASAFNVFIFLAYQLFKIICT